MNAKEKIEKIIFDIEELATNDCIKASEISEIVAANLFMGYRELNDVFKFFTDRSLNEYIKERKMMAAYELLIEQDDFNINQCIEISGLDNQSSFGKKFKEVFGVSPYDAFTAKDQSKCLPPLSWNSIFEIHSKKNESMSEEKSEQEFFGVTSAQYKKILEAQEYQALYDFNDSQSLAAFKIAESENAPLKKAFALVDDYLNCCEIILDKKAKGKNLEWLMSAQAKKLKKVYFTVNVSIYEAMDIIDIAKENNYSLTKKHIEYLAVYCQDPYFYFDEFLSYVEKFEELGGADFEEYWEMLSSGFFKVTPIYTSEP